MCLTLTLTLTQARTPKLIKYGMGSIILVPTKLSDPTQWAGFRYLDPANIENKTRNTHTQFFSHWHLCDASFNSAGFPFFLFPFCYIYLCCSMSLSVHKTLSNDWSIQMCPPYRCVHPTSTATSYQWGWCSRKWGSVCDCLYLVPVVVDLPLSLYNDRQ